MIEKRDRVSTFRTTKTIHDMLEEVCESENRTKGRMLEVMIIKYYEEFKSKENK